MCRIDDVEACQWFGTTIRTARKEHRCRECGRTITRGERYALSSYAYDGTVSTNKACEHCHAARAWLERHCGGWVTEQLHEELLEHFHDGYREDGVARLCVGIKRQWRTIRGALMPVPALPPRREVRA